MPAATIPGGRLKPLKECYIMIPDGDGDFQKIELTNLPEITDSKSATYNDETIIGRSSPMKTYSQSDNRNISMQLHFVVSAPDEIQKNLGYLRAIQSAVYPRDRSTSGPFLPPPVCRIKCGSLLSMGGELCVILKNYSVKFPTEVAWDEDSYAPFKFDVETSWDVVYKSSSLPGQERIYQLGK